MFSKEPTEVSTIRVDWSDWLGARTISTSTWDVPAGITKVSDSIPTTQTTEIELSGGTWGVTYEISNTILASDGDSETRSIIVTIQRSVSYCTPIEVRRRMFGGAGSGGSATPAALPPAELEALIEQASRMFDLVCGVPEGYFNPAPIPIATSKTVYGDGTSYLGLPAYVPGTLNATITLPDGYTAPTFIELDGYLVLTTSTGVLPPFSGSYNGWWPGWTTGVAVTVSAIWGFREVPANVKLAVIELVVNLVRETDPINVKLTNLDGQALREWMPPRVLAIAKRLKAKAGVAFV